VDTIPIEQRSWHDNSVHGFALGDFNSDEGTGTLTLDIDHIQEWIPVDGAFKFKISPALLHFRGVFGLKLHLDYSVGSMALSAFQIDSIERQIVHGPYGNETRWRIPIANHKGEITFLATSRDLEFTGDPVESDSQELVRGTTLGGGQSWGSLPSVS
jgi:hypothetical protein